MHPFSQWLITLVFTAVSLFSLTGCQSAQQAPHDSLQANAAPNLPTEQTTVNPMAFTVIQKVSTAQIRGILPESLQQPVVVVFKSKYCHDCQRMAPELSKISAQHPNTYTLVIDVQYDKATRGSVISAFRPAVIPVVVAIQRGGTLDDVMVGYHDAAAIQALYQRIAPRA